MSIFHLRTTCRVCDSPELVPVLSLGDQYISDFVSADTASVEGVAAPLELVLCNNPGCGLLQLRHTCSRDLLYRHYWYKSGMNQTMRDALADITTGAERITGLASGDIVVDIGCNDGTLLRSYKTDGIVRVGFEPARNLVADAEVGTTRIINDFFEFKMFDWHFPGKKARIVTAIAMFYDLEDPNSFVSDVRELLAADGVFVIQMNYLLSMLQQNAFDNIGHEHLEYYSLASLQTLLRRHGLEVFDVERNEINGGSFRAYIGHIAAHARDESVPFLEAEERHLLGRRAYSDFASRITSLKAKIHAFISQEKARGKVVYVYGASNRGNTLLQYFGLDHRLISAAAEVNPAKFGRRTVGTGIPIIPEEQARRDRPEYFLVLPWAFLEEFKRREREYLGSGGKFIVPLPDMRIVTAADELRDGRTSGCGF
jgi:SAM-dependent methyltransferase